MKNEEARLASLKQLDILDSDPEAAFDCITSLAARLFDVPIALVSLVDSERQWFKSHHGLDLCQTSRDSSFCNYALDSKEVMVVPDATKDSRFATNPLVLGEPGIRFYAGAPLWTPNDQIVGTLCIIDTIPRSLVQEDLEVLSNMAALVMDEMQLRLSRKELHVRENYWRALIAGTSDVITVLDKNGQILYQSPAVTSILGYSVEELVGRSIFEFLHPDDLKSIGETLRFVVENSVAERTVDFRVRHQDGTWRSWEAVGKNRLDDANIQGLIITSRDVTDRRQMQERLLLLESVVTNTNDTIIVTEAEPLDEPGPRILYVNDAFTSMTGYSSEEVLGRSPRLLQGSETQREPLDHLRHGLETYQTTNIQILNHRKDGTSYWAEMSVSPVRDESGRVIRFISIQRDVTANKNAEEAIHLAHQQMERSNLALRESQEQLSLALNAGSMGTWERDHETDSVRWSAQTESLYGLSPGAFKGTLDAVVNLVHPDDQALVINQLLSQKTKPVFTNEYRIVCPDGSVRWLENRGRLIEDEEGQPKATVGVVLDVTERKRDLEGAQQETLKRLALAAEYRDDDTGLHTQRVGRLSRDLAERLGLPQPLVQLIGETAPLHDVGKIGISDTILLKPSALTKEEFALMRSHTAIGAGILSGSNSPWLQMAEVIALNHHVRWDGTGYNKLSGEDIPLVGAIVCVADVFDALTHERPYKKAWSVREAVEEIQSQSGRQFNPRVVEAFLTLNHEDYL